MEKTAKLIILRGPSGSGKTTIARRLRREAKRPTAYIEWDYFHFGIVYHCDESGDRYKFGRQAMIASILSLLENGVDVVLDGSFFDVTQLDEEFEKLINGHPGKNYMFYFDVSLETTIARHKTREKRHEFGEDKLKDWYVAHEPSGHNFEMRIAEDLSEDEAVALIQAEVGM